MNHKGIPRSAKRLHTLKDARALGVNYSRQRIRRLELSGKIPPLYRRAPHCRAFLTDEHIAALTGCPPLEPEAA